MSHPDSVMRGNVLTVVLTAPDPQAFAEIVEATRDVVSQAPESGWAIASLAPIGAEGDGQLLTVSNATARSVAEWRELLDHCVHASRVTAAWDRAIVADFLPDVHP